MKLSEMDFAAGKSRLLKKELSCKEIQKILPKSVKRQPKQNSYLDDSTKEFLPRKKLKLSTSDTAVHNIENELSVDGYPNKQKQIESPFSESLDMTDSTASISNITKGTKPIQALLAKNTGNKVTLTMSTIGSSPVNPVLSCQTSSKSPLQVLYKMPGGHCVPIDMQNNSMKIQVQPAVDYKPGDKATGEKLMQQVLILPKNFLIHQRETKNVGKDILSLQHKTTDQQGISLPQPMAVHTTLATSLPASSVNAATTFLSIPDIKTNAAHLPPRESAVKRLPVLPSITSTGGVLTSVAKISQNEITKTKTVVSPASFPVTSSTVSSTIQSLTTPLSQNVSAGTRSSSPRLPLPQKSNDAGEAKQELKTVCIRDSQSILVRTRGGNTGIVKVQTNADHCPPGNLSPSSVFTYTPQLQAFLVPKTTQLTTSTFSVPTLVQSSLTTSASIATLPSGVNHILSQNMACAFGQSHNSSTVSHGMQKSKHVSSSPAFLPPVSSSNIVKPTLPNSSGNAVGILPGNIGHSISGINQTPFINQRVDGDSAQNLATQPEATATSSGSLMCGSQIPKLMLVTNPPLLSSCGTAGVNLIPPPKSTGLSAQKLVFINTPLTNIQSTSSLTSESFKQAFHPTMSKTYVKSTEQPQLVLIPSTVGASLKVNTSPTVSQIKDVKIGVNIGQAIINNTGNTPNVPPINIIQSAVPKEMDEKNTQNVILPLSTSGGLLPLTSDLVSQSITPVSESPIVIAQTLNTSTTANACLDSSVAWSGNATGTRPTVLVGGIGTSTKVTPVPATRLQSSTAGNTVAISTVKTGHLASSVLISSTQPTVSHPSLSTFQLPVTVALPGPVNGAPKMIHKFPQLPAVSIATHCTPLSKEQQSSQVHCQSPGIPAVIPPIGSTQTPQSVLPPNLPNAGKVISLSNLVPLPCPQLPPNFVKPAPALSCAPVASTIHMAPVSSVAGGQLNESFVQQKIIINTCTPLGPGTQIMINGTRFIVPPQGLGVGSHVLLISTNPKLGPLLTVSNGHGFQRVSHAPPDPQKITQVSDNTLSWQPSKQPLKSSTKIVNSLGAANTLPIVHATPQIVNSVAKQYTPPSATALSPSLVTTHSATTTSKTSLISTTHTDNSQVQDRASVLHLDTSIKKLMVSPEGAILNAINTPMANSSSLPSSLSPDTVSTTRNPAVVFPNFLKSSIGIPDTAAS